MIDHLAWVASTVERSADLCCLTTIDHLAWVATTVESGAMLSKCFISGHHILRAQETQSISLVLLQQQESCVPRWLHPVAGTPFRLAQHRQCLSQSPSPIANPSPRRTTPPPTGSPSGLLQPRSHSRYAPGCVLVLPRPLLLMWYAPACDLQYDSMSSGSSVAHVAATPQWGLPCDSASSVAGVERAAPRLFNLMLHRWPAKVLPTFRHSCCVQMFQLQPRRPGTQHW